MDVVLRDADPGDVPAIVEAYIASWRAGYAGLLPSEIAEGQSRLRRNHDWRGAIASPASTVLVAIDDQRLVGVVEATEQPGEDRDLPEITMLYVVPSAWGGPTATALLAAGTLWIRGRGHGAARLRVVEQQARARRFYEREGWQIDTDLPPSSNEFYRLIYYRRDLDHVT